MKETSKISTGNRPKASHGYKQSARAGKLEYVTDTIPGIIRIRRGKGFGYILNGKTVKNKKNLERIRQLVIPPAWNNVWICPRENGHIQATGYDVRKRKQYLYHAKWASLRNETKFFQLLEFGKALPLLRVRLKKDLREKELNEKKVLAIMISLMEQTYIRVGNKSYEKLYGSYGLTTLKDKNVIVQGDKLEFSFKGKKGISHRIILRNKKLAKAIKLCRDIPGKELFQYYDAGGEKKCIDSGMLNNYLKESTGKEFTAKDFRTWAGSYQALKSLVAMDETNDESVCKKNILAALDEVSKKLGNSRSICRKYYVHPVLLKLYEENELDKFCRKTNTLKSPKYLEPGEHLLLKILERHAQNFNGN